MYKIRDRVDKAEMQCIDLCSLLLIVLFYLAHYFFVSFSSCCNVLLIQVSSCASHRRWSLPCSTQSPETAECDQPGDVGVSEHRFTLSFTIFFQRNRGCLPEVGHGFGLSCCDLLWQWSSIHCRDWSQMYDSLFSLKNIINCSIQL